MTVKMTLKWGLILTVLLVSQISCASWGKKKAPIQARRSLTPAQKEELLKAVDTLQQQVDARQTKAAKGTSADLLDDFPQIAEYELGTFIDAEMLLSQKKYLRAAKKYEKSLEDYPENTLKDPTVKRLFNIGMEYLNGRKRVFLGLFRLNGYAQGIEMLETIAEFEGLDDPNGLGVKGALAIADNYENRQLYEDAYLKWLEISTVWDDGLLGKQALLGMASNKHASYNKHPVPRRHLFDASSLKAAKTYYEKFTVLYPEEAQSRGIPGIIADIEEQMAFKEYSIGQFYLRTGETQAANIYFDAVLTRWPDSETAQMVRETLNQSAN
jgi:tetratricopeptide (TPR) repeat protein